MHLTTGSAKHNSSDDEKAVTDRGHGVVEPYYADAEDPLEENEVFKKTHDGVNFRTVGWPRASVIFLKGMVVPHEELVQPLTRPQSSSQPESSASLRLCIVLERWAVRCQSLAGEL